MATRACSPGPRCWSATPATRCTCRRSSLGMSCGSIWDPVLGSGAKRRVQPPPIKTACNICQLCYKTSLRTIGAPFPAPLRLQCSGYKCSEAGISAGIDVYMEAGIFVGSSRRCGTSFAEHHAPGGLVEVQLPRLPEAGCVPGARVHVKWRRCHRRHCTRKWQNRSTQRLGSCARLRSARRRAQLLFVRC